MPINLFSGSKGNKDNPKKKEPEVVGTRIEVGFAGGEIAVNPTPTMQLERSERRLQRVDLALTKFKANDNERKEMEFSSVRRKVEMQIKLLKGEY